MVNMEMWGSVCNLNPYRLTRNTGTRKTSISDWGIRRHTDSPSEALAGALGRTLEKQFSRTTATASLSPMSVSDLMKVDTNSPSEMDVRGEVGFV